MATHTAPTSLPIALQQHCERLRTPRHSVLFRRGEKAVGMFVVFSGKVSLDFGVDSSLVRTYGIGALVGLPATITGRNYSMTATVTEDAELGFWSSTALDSLLRARPDLCHQLMVILGERMAEHHEALKALVTGDKEPLQKSDVV
jgi:CRP-like cAMP-binding protein